MTTVKFYQDRNSTFCGFEISGHAGYARRGQGDIVCAAISMLVNTTINSIEKFAQLPYSYEEDEKSGYMKFMLKGMPNSEAELLLKSMELGLSALAEQYKKNLTLRFEEV